MTSPDAASVVDILDQLIDIVRSARSVPMSASAMVNRSQVVELLTTARDILPDQLVEADGLLAEVDSVTARAHDEAARIRERAEHDAEDIVAQAREQLGEAVSVYLDGGECRGGAPSTIVGFDGARIRLYREGAVSRSDLSLVGEVAG